MNGTGAATSADGNRTVAAECFVWNVTYTSQQPLEEQWWFFRQVEVTYWSADGQQKFLTSETSTADSEHGSLPVRSLVPTPTGSKLLSCTHGRKAQWTGLESYRKFSRVERDFMGPLYQVTAKNGVTRDKGGGCRYAEPKEDVKNTELYDSGHDIWLNCIWKWITWPWLQKQD